MPARHRLKPAHDSRVEMTEIVLPEDTNPYGHARGCRVMTLIDNVAVIASTRHCRTNVVTAPFDSLTFRSRPGADEGDCPLPLGAASRVARYVRWTRRVAMC